MTDTIQLYRRKTVSHNGFASVRGTQTRKIVASDYVSSGKMKKKKKNRLLVVESRCGKAVVVTITILSRDDKSPETMKRQRNPSSPGNPWVFF